MLSISVTPQFDLHTKHVKYDDVIQWKHFQRNWPFVRGIHRSPVNSPHKGQWRGALMFSLICAWINAWVNNHEASDAKRYRAHYDVIVMNRDMKRLQGILSLLKTFINFNNVTLSYTTGKKYGIFFISANFCIFVGCVRYLFMWFTFLQTDITFGDLFTLNSKMNHKGSKIMILVLFLY